MRTDVRTPALAVLAGLTLLILTACGGSGAHPKSRPGGSDPSGTAGTPSVANTGTGGSGSRSTSSYTAGFARCMRANGVPSFPDPNGKPDQLGPGSGFDPNAPAFQSALNGPCRSLAPQSWLASGPVTNGGGS